MSKKLDDLKAKYAELGSTIQALEQEEAAEAERRRREKEANRVGLGWKPKSRERFFAVRQALSPDEGGKFMVDTYSSSSGSYARISKMPFFRTYEQAQAFAEAFQVLLELRAQSGVVDPQEQWKKTEGDYFYIIGLEVPSQLLRVITLSTFASTLSPVFATFGDAESAICAVGHDRILKAFKTLQFIKISR